jgi:hypothetical protein
MRLLAAASLLPGAAVSLGGPSRATMNKVITYRVYDDPSDQQNREAIWEIRLYVTESESDQDSIGWAIGKIEVVDLSVDPDKVYTDQSPTVDTADGLWWVTHADLEDPQVAEFDDAPPLSGTADAPDPQEPDLEYELAGAELSSPEDTYFGVCAGLDVWLKLVTEGDPALNRPREPVELEMDDDPPL